MKILLHSFVRIAKLSMIFMVSTHVLANLESDQFLASQGVNENNVTADLIETVKVETKKPVDIQIKNSESIADMQFQQIKQQNLEESAVSDYELKRKTDPGKLMQNEKHEYLPPRAGSGVYKLQFENINVQLGTNIK